MPLQHWQETTANSQMIKRSKMDQENKANIKKRKTSFKIKKMEYRSSKTNRERNMTSMKLISKIWTVRNKNFRVRRMKKSLSKATNN